MSDNLPNKNLFVSVAGAAKLLGVSIDTIRRWDTQGILKSTRLDGKNRYFLKSDLKTFKKTRPLSISEAASALSISVSTLRRLERKGVIVAERSQNGERLYSPSRINEILASRKKGGRERVDLYAPIPTTLHGAHASFAQDNVYSPQTTFQPQTPMQRTFSEESRNIAHDTKKSNFWKKNHLLSHIAQFNVIGEYMSFPRKGFKGMKFGNQAAEYRRGIVTITFLLLLSMGIFAFTVLRDVNDQEAVLAGRTPEAQRALSKLSPVQRAEVAKAAVLAATTTKGQFTVNIKSVFNEDIKVNNKNLDLGTGELTASNVIYSVIAGEGIGISEGQNPVISNSGVISIGEATGEITLGSGLSISNNVLSGSFQSVNSFANIVANGTTITAGSSNDTLTFQAGSNISLSASGKTITISATGGGSGTNYFALSGNNLYPTSTSYVLGIGNSAPTATLDVTGTFKVSGTTSLNGITYTWPGADGSSSYILTTNGSGTLSWADPGTLPSTNYWTIASGTLYPNNPTLDLLVGGTTSASAKFGFINVNSGTPAIQISGTTVLTGSTLGSGVTTSSLTTVGALASGSIASGFGTITTANTITGTVLNGTTGVNTGASAGTQRIDSSGNLTNIGTTQFNTITYTWPSSGQGSSYVLSTNGSGTLSWLDPGTLPGVFTTGSGAIYPTNPTLDFLIGGSTTASAKFAILNVNSGIPTATISGNLVVYPNTGNGGRVGIGVVSPAAALDVRLGGILAGTNTFTKASGYNNPGEISLDNGTTDTPGLKFYSANNTNYGIDNTNGTLRFVSNLDESGGAATMTLSSNGSLSIANTGTTGTALSITSSTLTTGKLINATGTWTTGSSATGNTISGTFAPSAGSLAFNNLYIPVTDSSSFANTVRSVLIGITASGNAAKTLRGLETSVTSSSTTGDILTGVLGATTATGALASAQTRYNYGLYGSAVSTAATAQSNAITHTIGVNSIPSATLATDGTDNVYGFYSSTTGTHAADAGTINQYGVYVANGTSGTNGTSSKYGVYIEGQSGADNNYQLGLAGTSSGVVGIKASATVTSWTMTLPTDAGSSGYFLMTDGSGVTSWSGGAGTATLANQVEILARIGTNTDPAGTTTLFARLADIDDTKIGTSGDAVTLFGKLGNKTDNGQCTGTLSAGVITAASCSNETIFGIIRNLPGQPLLSQFTGDGSNGAIPASGALEPGIYQFGSGTVNGTLTMTASATNSKSGLFLFVQGTLTVASGGNISVVGFGANSGDGGNGGTSGVLAKGGSGGGLNGTNGTNGSNAAAAVAGGTASGFATLASDSLGGAGGGGGGGVTVKGGAAGGGAGGNGGNGSATTTAGADGIATSGRNQINFLVNKTNLFLSFGAGGGGGAGGAVSGAGGGGGGGGGGGIVWLRTHSYTNNGTVSAAGGNGGTAGVTAANGGVNTGGAGAGQNGSTTGGGAGGGNQGSNGGGGGGGAGGGVLYIEANSIVVNSGGAISARGGNGGNGGNGSAAGSPGAGGNGANGFLFVEIVP